MRGRRALLARHARRLVRYATGSGVATVCSAAAFALVLWLGAAPATATLLGWFAGAVPNYLLNRSWVWKVDGRPDVRREVVPYVAVVLLTLGLATGATTLAERLLQRAGATESVVFVGVNAAFLGVYALMALVRYVLLHQLFRRLPTRPAAVPADAQTAAAARGAAPSDDARPEELR